MPKLLSHAQRVPQIHSTISPKTPRIVATSKPPKDMPERKPLWKQVATIPSTRNRAMNNNLHKIESVTKKSNINQIKQQKMNTNEAPAPDSNMNRKTNRVINKDQKPYFTLTYLTTP